MSSQVFESSIHDPSLILPFARVRNHTFAFPSWMRSIIPVVWEELLETWRGRSGANPRPSSATPPLDVLRHPAVFVNFHRDEPPRPLLDMLRLELPPAPGMLGLSVSMANKATLELWKVEPRGLRERDLGPPVPDSVGRRPGGTVPQGRRGLLDSSRCLASRHKGIYNHDHMLLL